MDDEACARSSGFKRMGLLQAVCVLGHRATKKKQDVVVVNGVNGNDAKPFYSTS
jgi:hypothetical protein